MGTDLIVNCPRVPKTVEVVQDGRQIIAWPNVTAVLGCSYPMLSG